MFQHCPGHKFILPILRTLHMILHNAFSDQSSCRMKQANRNTAVASDIH
jgi:hypothetical protein